MWQFLRCRRATCCADPAFDIALSRYLPNGRIDRSFGRAGIVPTNAGPGDSDDDVQEPILDDSGGILIGASTAPTANVITQFRSEA